MVFLCLFEPIPLRSITPTTIANSPSRVAMVIQIWKAKNNSGSSIGPSCVSNSDVAERIQSSSRMVQRHILQSKCYLPWHGIQQLTWKVTFSSHVFKCLRLIRGHLPCSAKPAYTVRICLPVLAVHRRHCIGVAAMQYDNKIGWIRVWISHSNQFSLLATSMTARSPIVASCMTKLLIKNT